jgi:hypothetical protein
MTEDLTPIDHLQRAAIEMIAAARSALDILEEVVSDPAGLTGVINRVGGRVAAHSSGSQSSSAPQERVEHIPIR